MSVNKRSPPQHFNGLAIIILQQNQLRPTEDCAMPFKAMQSSVSILVFKIKYKLQEDYALFYSLLTIRSSINFINKWLMRTHEEVSRTLTSADCLFRWPTWGVALHSLSHFVVFPNCMVVQSIMVFTKDSIGSHRETSFEASRFCF